MNAAARLQSFADKKETISVIGLGYVGLPVALEFARKFRVIGFDIRADRVELLKQNIDFSSELDASAFEGCDITFTANPDDLKVASFHIVAVPTPIDKHTQPDLKPLLGASRNVGRALKPGDCVVFESTVYPGCTEEDCIPLLEQESGLTFGIDFTVGYSPERINPGDKEHTLTRITKVVSGSDADTLDLVAGLYGTIVTAGVYRASSIKVAEAAKIIENTQRDLNIALMNELSIIFNKLNINTYDVLEAAGTKWNFLKFQPGLVGGHCIGVDPYYLTYKSKELGHEPAVILAGRAINDQMGAWIAKKIVQQMVRMHKEIHNCRVLLLGATFKENVTDIRNSKVADLYRELEAYSMQVDMIDPHASAHEVEEEYGIKLASEPCGQYDAIIVAVAHNEYRNLDRAWLDQHSHQPIIFADLKGIYRNRFEGVQYWSL